jgi:hypothetical protein
MEVGVRRWNRVCSQKCRGIGRRDVRARAATMVESGDTRAHVCVDFAITKMPGTMTEYERNHRAGPRRYDCVHFVMNFGLIVGHITEEVEAGNQVIRASLEKPVPIHSSVSTLFITYRKLVLRHLSLPRYSSRLQNTLMLLLT